MKNFTIYKKLIVATALLTATGCTSFLEVESIGKATIESFFSDVQSLQAAGVGLHRTILEFYDDDYLRYPDLAGDACDIVTVNAGEDVDKVFNFTSVPADNAGYPRNIWVSGYVVSTNANNILYYGKSLATKYTSQDDQATINKVFAWAYFARALSLFDLCNVYAQPYNFTADASHLGVPIVTTVHGFDDVIARSSVKDCYDRIIKDLEQALSMLDSETIESPYYISGIACEALLARVFLYKNDYDNAEKYSKKVMDKIRLSPRDEYEQMFRGARTVAGTESIFRLNNYNVTGAMKSFTDPTVLYKVIPTKSLVDSFAADDVRKQMMSYTGLSTENENAGKTFTAITKYCAYKDVTDDKDLRYDPFVLRCSEMYLIHAEALCNKAAPDLNGAANDLKALIARATGKSVDQVTLSWSSAADMNKLIDAERRKELCFEGHRLFDITRRGGDLVRDASCNAQTKTIRYPDYRFVLPICEQEMTANEAMVQNDGYEKL